MSDSQLNWVGEQPTSQTPEIKADAPTWKKRLGEAAYQALPALGMVGGGAAGTAIGTPGGPLGMAVGGATLAGYGTYAGEQAAKGINALLGTGITPEQANRGWVKPMTEGAMMELGGPILGKAGSWGVSKLPRMGRPTSLSQLLAGEALEKSRGMTPLEESILSPGRREMENALLRTPEAGPVPRSVVTLSPRDVALERLSIPRVGGVLEAQKKQAAGAISRRVDEAIPSVSKGAERVRQNIERFNADATAQAEAKAAAMNADRQRIVAQINEQRQINADKLARKQPALSQRELQAAEQQYAAEFEAKYGEALSPAESIKTSTQQTGANIYSEAAKAEEASKARFSSPETGYNQPKFVDAPPAPPENELTSFVANNKPPVNFSAYADPEPKLAKFFGGAEGEAGTGFDMSFDYRTLREISEAAGKAQRRAARNPDAGNVAQYFGDLKASAERTIEGMLEPSAAEEYRALNKLYATQHVPAFKQGTLGNTVLAYGKKVGNLKTAEGDIPKLFKNADNIDALMRGFGTAEVAARPGMEAMAPLSEMEVLQLGREKTADVLRPLFNDELASAYRAGGRKSVNSWVRKNEPLLKKLGIYGDYAPWLEKNANIEKLKRFLPTADKVPYDVLKASKAQVVADTLKLDDPLKAYNYLANADNPKQAVTQLLSVSKDPQYKQALQELIRDGLKADMKGTGINIFNPELASSATNAAKSQRLREVLPYLYDKKQLRALKDYHIIMSRLEGGASTEGLRAQLGKNAAAKLEEAVAAIPMGYKGYWAKHGLLTAIGFIEKKYEQAAIELLDRAITDPKAADALLKAYRGETKYPLQRMLESINAEQKSTSDLSKTLRTVGKALTVEKLQNNQTIDETGRTEQSIADIAKQYGVSEDEARKIVQDIAAQRGQ